MLVRLLIKNYALIDNSDISFHKGLNMITGETGAGKSILMGALGLILGNRAEGKQFFDDTKKCVIEGYFNISNYNLQSFFQEYDLDYELETIIRREIAIDGKSRAFVNDSPVTLNTLKQLGERLIDIHSQHATLQITTEEFQLFVLDSLAHNEDNLVLFRQDWKELKRIDKHLRDIKEQMASANAELDYNQFLFDELEKLNVLSGEVKKLEEEQQQLENAEEIKRNLLASNYLISDGDQNVLSLLKESIQQVQSASKFLSDATSLVDRLQSAYIDIKDVSNEIASEEGNVNVDDKRLEDINSRLSEIYNLLKKHRVDTEDELIAIKDDLSQKLLIALNQDEVLEKLEKERETQLTKVTAITAKIHDLRVETIPKVQKYVQDVLTSVGMPNAQLKINLEQLGVDKINSNGCDAVSFLFSANKGQSLQAIQKVASGGELSRVMLAIKSLVAKSSALPTIIFDEIDTGISGEVALKVGEVMEDLSENMQVIAISHLPQIASKGTAHFKVYKNDKDNKTYSNILLLDKEQRILEIAQMLSGINPGEAALQHAKDLLGQ